MGRAGKSCPDHRSCEGASCCETSRNMRSETWAALALALLCAAMLVIGFEPAASGVFGPALM